MAIYTPLMEHQKKIVRFAIDKDRKYAAIFSDYGTGKTLCALKIIDWMKFHRVLVVSTKTSIQSVWPSEIRKHTNFSFISLLGSRRGKVRRLMYGIRKSVVDAGYYHGSAKNLMIFLVNFDGVKNIAGELGDAKFDAIIVDESTKIKSPSTARTKFLWALGRTCGYRYIMTGFPVTEGLQNIYAQIKFLDNGVALGGSYWKFMNTCFVRIGQKLLPKKKSSAMILDRIKDFSIRVTNKDLKLPPKIYKELEIEKTEEQARLLKSLHDYFRAEFGKVKIDTEYIFDLLIKCQQICDGFIQDKEGNRALVDTEKDETLIDTLDEMDIERNKVIIWCGFRFSIKKIEKILTKLGHPVLTLTGDTKNVSGVVDAFQGSKKYNVLIATQKKAAESLNLSACRFAIYYSNIWSYDARGNSEARIRRKGSEHHHSIVYVDFVTKGTVERQILNCLKKKSDLVKELQLAFKSVGREL